MKEILLPEGKTTLVDDEDYEYLNQWKWSFIKAKNTDYARRVYRAKGKHFTIKMHRLIMNCPDGLQVDHKDHNGLNNQKSNLRICTKQQNRFNSQKEINCSSKYKGVSISKGFIKASIGGGGKLINLGYFKTEIEAAKAYDKEALRIYKEFANIFFAFILIKH